LNVELRIIRLIEKQIKIFIVPSVTRISRRRNPFQVLVSCILSLRTKDKTTIEASLRLFKAADNLYRMARLPKKRIQALIYPVGFYRTKAKTISDISKRIISEFRGRVPDTIDGLLSFKGVGRKTANLVLGLGYNIPAICVDTHVHRIANRLGWVRTILPSETEEGLMKIIPKREWINLNTTLVTFGQNLCLPVSPFCSKCSVAKFCKREGVLNRR